MKHTSSNSIILIAITAGLAVVITASLALVKGDSTGPTAPTDSPLAHPLEARGLRQRIRNRNDCKEKAKEIGGEFALEVFANCKERLVELQGQLFECNSKITIEEPGSMTMYTNVKDCQDYLNELTTCIANVKDFEPELAAIPDGWTCPEYLEAHQAQAWEGYCVRTGKAMRTTT
jgi:hypothetical protein